MKYLALIIAVAKVVEPLVEDFKAAVAEGKSADPATVKLQKILQDAESAIESALTAL